MYAPAAEILTNFTKSLMEYYSFNRYLHERFGCKVYKISINGGFTCPNRDGTLGTRGCIFCSAGGSGDFAESPELSITQQIEKGKERVKNKLKSGKYIAYFQAFTNTYAPVETLRKKFTQAINHPDIVMLSVATRPDCLPEEVIELLKELNDIKPVCVELGLQTIHEKSAEYIRRGYKLECYDNAVKRLKAAGLEVVCHIILGLPGETKSDMLESVDYACKSGINGIKLQLLHVLKGTDLAKDYENEKFRVLTMDEYLDILKSCLDIIPKSLVIHRLTGDGAKKDLIAPLWSADKKRVLNAVSRL